MNDEEIDRQYLATRSPSEKLKVVHRTRVVLGEDFSDPHWITDRQVEALSARALEVEPTEQARAVEGTIHELAWSCLRVNGRHHGISIENRTKCVELAMSTSDFPLALGDIVSKVFVETYSLLDPAFRYISAPMPVDNLRAATMVRAAEVPGLLKVGESGEVKEGLLPDSGESIQAAHYGRIINIPNEVLVNDDVGFLRNLGVGLALRQAEFENTLVMGAFLSGASGNGSTLRDGVQMFATARGNYTAASPGGFTASTTFAVARAALLRMASSAGGALNLKVSTILCGPDAVTGIEAELAKLSPAQATQIRVVPDALIGTAWYLIAANLPPMRHATLQGSAPRLIPAPAWASWPVDGTSLKFSYDFGASALEWRCYKNAGTP